MKLADRVFGVLLILSSCGHTVGTILWTPFMSGLFVWSLGASIAAALTGVLNVVRAGRPGDRTIAVIATAATAGWLMLCVAFGKSIGNFADPRVVGNSVIATALLFFGIRTIAMIHRESPFKFRVEPLPGE
jgi:hypothetical protein